MFETHQIHVHFDCNKGSFLEPEKEPPTCRSLRADNGEEVWSLPLAHNVKFFVSTLVSGLGEEHILIWGWGRMGGWIHTHTVDSGKYM